MSKLYIETKDLLEKYGVSNVTVAKWIKDTLDGDTTLKYEIVGKRHKFLNTLENWFIFDKLGSMATTKRNQIFSAETEASEEFCSYFSDEEVLEIARDLEIRNMINLKFAYRGVGTDFWDEFYNENYGKEAYKVPLYTEEALGYYLEVIADKIKGYDEVTVIDLGCGNGKPISKFLGNLAKKVNVKRYIAVDISKHLAEIAVENVKNIVPSLEYHSFQKDFEQEKLGEIFSMGLSSNKKTINLVAILGVVLPNTYDAETILKNIQKAMSLHDILLIDGVKSNPASDVNFQHVTNVKTSLAKHETWIPRSLGINVDNCEYVAEYDEINKQKVRFILLDKDYKITFKLNNNLQKVVELKKRSKLILWFSFRTSPRSYNAILEKTNFNEIDTLTLPNDLHFIISAKPKDSRVKNPFQ